VRGDDEDLVRRVTEAVVKAMREEIPPRRAPNQGGEQQRQVQEAKREKVKPARGEASQGGGGSRFPPKRVSIRERVSYPERISAHQAKDGARGRKRRGAADQARSKQRAHAWKMQGRGHALSPDRAVTDRAGKLKSQIGEVIGRIEVAASSIRRECLKIPAEKKETDSNKCRCWWFPCEHGRIN
jgi:hypothetical protein